MSQPHVNEWDEETAEEVPHPGPLPRLPDTSPEGRVDTVRSLVHQWQDAVATPSYTFEGIVSEGIEGYLVGWAISKPASWDQVPNIRVTGGQSVGLRFNPADVLGVRLKARGLEELLERGMLAIIELPRTADNPNPSPYYLTCTHRPE